MQQTLLAGEYAFSPLTERRLLDGEIRQLWCAQDALVLKAMAIVLGDSLEPMLSERCFHLKGHGGAKAAVREVLDQLGPQDFVMKSDVKGYYDNIDHDVLFDLVQQYVPDEAVQRLSWQYMRRTICYGGNYWDITRGISLGCPLSPLMAALYLKPLDDRADTKNRQGDKAPAGRAGNG